MKAPELSKQACVVLQAFAVIDGSALWSSRWCDRRTTIHFIRCISPVLTEELLLKFLLKKILFWSHLQRFALTKCIRLWLCQIHVLSSKVWNVQAPGFRVLSFSRKFRLADAWKRVEIANSRTERRKRGYHSPNRMDPNRICIEPIRNTKRTDKMLVAVGWRVINKDIRREWPALWLRLPEPTRIQLLPFPPELESLILIL